MRAFGHPILTMPQFYCCSRSALSTGPATHAGQAFVFQGTHMVLRNNPARVRGQR